MWFTRSLRARLALTAIGVALLPAAVLPVLAQDEEAADPPQAGVRVIVEIRGLHYDAGDRVPVRITARNEGDEAAANPLANPLVGGFVVIDPDGKTHSPENAGSRQADLQPARLISQGFFGTVVDLAPHFPVLGEIGTYRLLYRAGDVESNEVDLNVIAEYRPDSSFEATLHTSQGDLKMDLYPEAAPVTVRNFVDLARQGFYDGLLFHYVRPGDIAIGGDPNGDGSGGSGFNLPAEFSSRRHLAGTVGMVRGADPNSASSQFYICLAPRPDRDGRFTVFGQIVDGYETLQSIAQVPTTAQAERPFFRPNEPLLIESITIVETEAAAEVDDETPGDEAPGADAP